MKALALICIGFIFVSCEYTTVSQSLCENGYKDIRGFAGSYNWVLEDEKFPVQIKRIGKGRYTLTSAEKNTDELIYNTCKIGRRIIVESPIEGETALHLLELKMKRRLMTLSSILFDIEKLTENNVQYTYGSDEVQGIQIAVTQIENPFINARALLRLRSSDSSRIKYQLEFQKR